MAHCHPETRTDAGTAAALMALHAVYCMYFVALSRSIDDMQTSDATGSHAAPDHDLQRMLHHQVQALRLEFFSTKPPHIRVGLVAKQAEGVSSLNSTFSHISQLQLEYHRAHRIRLRLWTSVISGFLRALQPSDRTAGTGDALLMSWQDVALLPPLTQQFR